MAASDGERGPGRDRRAGTGRMNLVGLRAIESPAVRPAPCRPFYGDLQITFLDVLQLTRHQKNIINNESSAFFDLR